MRGLTGACEKNKVLRLKGGRKPIAITKFFKVMKEQYLNQLAGFYKQLIDLGDAARAIISDFVKANGNAYAFDEDDDPVWIGDDIYATSLETDVNGGILVSNSCGYSDYLHKMEDYRILEIAERICRQ